MVKRECPVPGKEGEMGRWSVDHVFVDQDGVPTLVEVKRSTDTRIRREVVGQLLEYAANALVYWSDDNLRQSFQKTCEDKGLDPQKILEEFLSPSGTELELDMFWDKVADNIRTGVLRLLFVADTIPPELRRIVEFLNEQMRPTDVLAVEIRRFAGEHQVTLVPTVLGITAKGERKRRPVTRQWDESSFMDHIDRGHGPIALATARKLLDWFSPRVTYVYWGTGISEGGFVPVIRLKDVYYQLLRCGTSQPSIQVNFAIFKSRDLLDADKRERLRQELNKIDGVSIPLDGIDKYPRVPLMSLADDGAFRKFTEIYQDIINAIQQ